MLEGFPSILTRKINDWWLLVSYHRVRQSPETVIRNVLIPSLEPCVTGWFLAHFEFSHLVLRVRSAGRACSW